MMATTSRRMRLRVPSRSHERAEARSLAATFGIVAPSTEAACRTLSGGNQQKVVIAKWLMSRPSIFIMDEPTRGVDVGAKHEIYTIINDLAAQGGSILFISSELDELIAMCDRIAVMSQGEIVAEYAQDAFDKEQILRSAFREGSGTT